jgi:amino acid permease
MRNNMTGKVAGWVRLLAVVLFSLQLFMAYHFATALISQQTTLSSLFTDSLPDILIMLFLNILFALVALTGRSPDRLFPVASLDLRQFLRRSH